MNEDERARREAADEDEPEARDAVVDDDDEEHGEDGKPEKKKSAARRKLEALMAEYGMFAIVVWFGIFALTWLGFVVAITLGFDVDTGGEGTGTVVIAYLATQATKPFRLAGTVAATPLVARAWHRFFPKKADEEDEEEDDEEEAG